MTKGARWYARHRQRILAENKVRYRADPGLFKAKNLRRYGVTLVWYLAQYSSQQGRCAICKQPEVGQSLAVDHEHASGRVRSLLCAHCNRMLGYAKERPDVLRRAAEYLELPA